MSRLHVDLNEGQFVEMGCLSCREDVTARLSIATPARMYVAALDCEECGDELVQFDAFTDEVADDPYWRKVDEQYADFKEGEHETAS